MDEAHDDFCELVKERPEWFPKPYMYGCGPGWHKLIRETCEKIAALNPPDFQFVQIKEKFGGLRLYAQGNTGEKTQEIYLGRRKTSTFQRKVCSVSEEASVSERPNEQGKPL